MIALRLLSQNGSADLPTQTDAERLLLIDCQVTHGTELRIERLVRLGRSMITDVAVSVLPDAADDQDVPHLMLFSGPERSGYVYARAFSEDDEPVLGGLMAAVAERHDARRVVCLSPVWLADPGEQPDGVREGISCLAFGEDISDLPEPYTSAGLARVGGGVVVGDWQRANPAVPWTGHVVRRLSEMEAARG